jgi:hypothetical protein
MDIIREATYTEWNKKSKTKATDWAPKMIQDLWDHMLWMWKYRNKALHANETNKVAQFKVEALESDIERSEARHE